MTIAAATPLQVKGGAFLIEERSPNENLTAEDLNEEHLAIARTVDKFSTNDVKPRLEAIRPQKPGVAITVLRKPADWNSRYRSPRNSAAWKWICPL